MEKTYTLFESDFDILRRRKPEPCTYPSCQNGKAPGDYAYMGCGKTISCSRFEDYMNWKDEATAAGVLDLAEKLITLDELRDQLQLHEQKIRTQIEKISHEYGPKVTGIISDKLYDGEY